MNKNIFLWGLYGFANTPLAAAIGGLYLAQWLVFDNHLDDIWYGGVFTLATILLLFTSPFWGAWSDQVGKRKPFITWLTLALLVSGGLLGIAATSSLPTVWRIAIVLVLFFVVQYLYQVSLIFYNAIIEQLSTPATVGKVSGIGDFFDEVGWLLGPAMLLPFATGALTLWGEPGRAQVFVPAVIVFAILGFPMIFWFREKAAVGSTQSVKLGNLYHDTVQGIRSLLRENKNTALFLIAFMFISDALLTTQMYFAIYLDQIFGINDTQKFLLLATMLVVATISAYIIGRLSDLRGIKKFLLLSCWILFGGLLAVALSFSLTLLFVLAAFLGVGFAGFYVTSRAMLFNLSPENRRGEYFGFYSTFQKFASIIGPLAWGITTLLLRDYGALKYRAAILVLALMLFVGVLLMHSVREQRGAEARPARLSKDNI